MKNKFLLFVLILLILSKGINLYSAVWYQTTFNDFNSGEKNYTAIRSTDTAAYIELQRTGASELAADSQTVGLYHMNDGGPAELSSSVQGSTVVALYHFNNGPATTLTSDANTVGLWHFDEILSAPAPLPSTVVGSTVVALYHFDNGPATELSTDGNTVGLWHFNEGDGYYALDSVQQTWSKRIPITINNGGSGLSDYQVWIPTTVFSTAQWSDIKGVTGQIDLDDVRFATGTASTARFFPYWIDDSTVNPKGFWVKVITVPAGSSTIYMYYGNASASAGSNMSATGLLFDDFTGTSVDSSKWDLTYGNAVIENNMLKLGPTDWSYVRSALTFSDLIFTFKTKFVVGGRTQVAFRWQTADTDMNEFDFGTPTQQFSVRKTVGGTWAILKTVDYTFSSDTWYWYKVESIGTGLNTRKDYYSTDGNNWTLITTTESVFTSGKVKIWSTDSSTNYVDDVRIRKYASAEPTTSAGTTETAGYSQGVNNGYVKSGDGSNRWDTQVPFTSFGKSMNFRGGLTGTTSDYIAIPENSNFVTPPVTYEAWVNLNTLGVKKEIIESDNGASSGVQFMIDTDNKLHFMWLEGSNPKADGSTVFTTGQWYHCAGVATATDIKVFVNGKLEGTFSAALSARSPVDMNIGSYRRGVAEFFNGKIDEVRVSNIARSAATICQDAGGAVDSSALGNHGGLNVATQTYTTSMTGFGNTLQFNGVNDKVVSSTASFPFGNTARTMECWIKTSQSAVAHIITYGAMTDNNGSFIYMTSGRMCMGFYNNDLDSGITINDNLWHLVSFTFDGSTVKTYVDGKAGASAAKTTNTSGGENFVIGIKQNGLYPFDGLIDEVRISSGALSAGQIAADAGVYTPDASSYNNKGYICNASTSTEVPFSTFGKSMLFEGGLTGTTSDFVDCGNSASLQLNTGTVEAWIKTSNAGTSYRGIVAKQSAYSLFLNSNELGVYDWDASAWRGTSKNLNDNNWHHVASSFESGVANGTKIYDNGQLLTSTIMTIFNQNVPVQIGEANAAQLFNGLIDEVRISNVVRVSSVICADAGGAVDSSAFGNHGGLNIATQTYTTSDMTGFGKYLQFNGVNDKVNVSTLSTTSDSLALTKGSVEAWIKTSNAGTGSRAIVAKKNAYGMFLNANEFGIQDYSVGWRGTGKYLNDNNWHLVSFTFDNGVANGSKVYIDGNLSLTTQMTVYDQTVSLTIGDAGSGAPTAERFNGSIDEVRISSGALTAGQIAADAGSYVADASGKGNFGVAVSTYGTAGGLSMWTGAGSAKFGANALAFDGVNDYIDLGNTVLLSTSSFTLENWFYANSDSSSGRRIIEYNPTTNGTISKYLSVSITSPNTLKVDFYTGAWDASYAATISLNQWNHVAAVWDGSKVNSYLNGVQFASESKAITAYNTSWKTYIGANANNLGADSWFDGKIDEVRISSRALSSGEISADALGPCYNSGDFVSDVKDTGENGTVFQNIYSSSEIPTGTSLNFYVHTSSVTSPYYWTAYSGPYGSGSALSSLSRYRYVQYRSTFTTTNTNYSALMNDCTIQYAANTVPSRDMASGVANSETQITWTANTTPADNEGDGIEYYFNGSAGNQSYGGGNTFINGGLTANTQYSCQVKVRDTPWLKESSLSGGLQRYTLPTAPTDNNVTCDKSTSTVYGTSLFTFSTTFGAGTFSKIMYKWDTSLADSDWLNTWNAGALSQNALTQQTSYYLHVKAFNGDNVENGTFIKGPYLYQSNYQGATDTTDTDFNAGLVKSSATIVGTGNAAYIMITPKATGGTITYSGEYTIHTFTSNGTFTVSKSGVVEYLVVAGGGAGGCTSSGSHYTGGGGAGGYKTGTGFNVAVGQFTITVGSGGTAAASSAGGNGTDSVFSSITATGGGGGGGFDSLSTVAVSCGQNGGSGGGESTGEAAVTIGSASPAGQGNNGGTGQGTWISVCAGGGGGGAGAVGGNAASNLAGGNGGAGVNNSISGASVGYAGGGGGASNGTNGTASHGGGIRDNAGTANTGGGGGAGGNGGSGIVVVRYLDYYPAGELQSRAIDTGKKGTRWGQVSWGQSVPAGTSIKLKTRTGDTATPDGTWSAWNSSSVPTGEWYTVATGTPVASPRSRYIQYISSFTTIYSTNTPQLNEVTIQYATNTATSPNLVSPANEIWISSSRPVFKWNFVDDEADSQTGYLVQLSTALNFSVINYASGDTSSAVSQYQPGANINNGNYYWHIKTSDTYGEWSVNSSSYQVKIDTAPPTGHTISSVVAYSTYCVVNWNTANDPADIYGSAGSGLASLPYVMRYSTSSNFETQVTTTTDWFSGASSATTSLNMNTTYYFQVKAKDTLGNEQWTSSSSAITLVNLPLAPTLSGLSGSSIQVAKNDDGNSSTVEYSIKVLKSWGTTYYVQVSNTLDTGIVWQTLTNWSFPITVTNLSGNTSYQFLLLARNYAGAISTGSFAGKTTLANQPDVPGTFETVYITTYSIKPSWTQNNAEGTTYRVQVSTLLNFSVIASTEETIVNSVTVSSMTANKSYYFRVAAMNSEGQLTSWTVLNNSNPKYTRIETPVLSDNVWTINSSSVTINLSAQTFSNISGGSSGLWFEENGSEGSPWASGWIPNKIWTRSENNPASSPALIGNTTYAFTIKSRNYEGLENDAVGPLVKGMKIEPIQGAEYLIYGSSIAIRATGTYSNLADGMSGINYTLCIDTYQWTNTGVSSSVWVKNTDYWYYTMYNGTGSALSPSTTYYFISNSRNYDGLCNSTITYTAKVTLPTTPVSPILALPSGDPRNRLGVEIQAESPVNSEVTQYAVAISTVSNFNPIYYVQTDRSTGTVECWDTKANWNAKLLGDMGSGGSVVGITGLFWNSTYYVKVKARSPDGTGSPYGVSVTTVTYPQPPADVHFTTPTAMGELNADWSDVSAMKYWVQISSDSTNWSVLNGDSGWISYSSQTFTGLLTNKKYYARAISRNLAGIYVSTISAGNWETNEDTGAYTLAESPSNLQITGIGYTTATVTWTGGNNPAGTATWYDVEASSNGFITIIDKSTSTYEGVLVDTFSAASGTGLSHNTTYQFRVRAINMDKLPTAYYTTGFSSCTLIDPPIDITVSGITQTDANLTINWPGTAPDLTDQGPGDGAYWERYPGIGSNEKEISVKTTFQDTYWRDEGGNTNNNIFGSALTANTTYQFKVKARNKEKAESGWAYSTINCTRIQPPSVFTDVVITTNTIKLKVAGAFNNLGVIDTSTSAVSTVGGTEPPAMGDWSDGLYTDSPPETNLSTNDRWWKFTTEYREYKGLAPNATYYFRSYSRNRKGTVEPLTSY
ncbi:MAG: DUF2341 domain-containing protein, partial [Elusimicrobiota bacterium]